MYKYIGFDRSSHPEQNAVPVCALVLCQSCQKPVLSRFTCTFAWSLQQRPVFGIETAQQPNKRSMMKYHEIWIPQLLHWKLSLWEACWSGGSNLYLYLYLYLYLPIPKRYWQESQECSHSLDPAVLFGSSWFLPSLEHMSSCPQVTLPCFLAMFISSFEGWRLPSGPAKVLAPQGDPPWSSVMSNWPQCHSKGTAVVSCLRWETENDSLSCCLLLS